VTEPLAPERLVDDLSISGSLRADLAAASRPPVSVSVEVGLPRLHAAIAAAPTVAGPRPWGGVALAGVAAVLLAAGVVALAVPAAPTLPAEPAAVSGAPARPPARPPAPTPAVPRAPAVAPAPVVAPELPPASPPEARSLRRVAARGDADTSAAAVAREAVLVRRGEQALEADPGRTLALLDELDRTVADGQLMQERQALRALALLGSGRAAEGARQARAFLDRYPRGTLSSRVRAALEQVP
jgi:hypothetical protein